MTKTCENCRDLYTTTEHSFSPSDPSMPPMKKYFCTLNPEWYRIENKDSHFCSAFIPNNYSSIQGSEFD